MQPTRLSPTSLEDKGAFSLSSLLLLLTGLILVSVLAALCQGPVVIAPSEVLSLLSQALWQAPPEDSLHWDVLWELRLPRIALALLAGGSLSLCGTAMQAAVQNPLADPYILGVSAGASFGATVFACLQQAGWAWVPLPLLAFLGAGGAALLVLLLAGSRGKLSTLKMILAGMLGNALFTALTNLLIYLGSNADSLQQITFWSMGSLAAASWEQLPLPALALATGSLFFFSQAKELNILLLGEETALTLGLQPAALRRRYLLAAALVTGIIVSTCGIIAFAGLMVPHILRGFVGPDHRKLIPASVLGGALFLLWADVAARSLLPTGELPIGIITAILGAPLLIRLLRAKATAY